MRNDVAGIRVTTLAGTANGRSVRIYRWRGTPGWNPAAHPVTNGVLNRRVYDPDTLARPCPREGCKTPAGRKCIGPSGAPLGQPHLDRIPGGAS